MLHARWRIAFCFVVIALFSLPFATAETPLNVAEPTTGFEGKIHPVHIEPHIAFLASTELAGRSGKGAIRAGNYIRDHFKHLGLKPLFENESYFQPIPASADKEGRKRIFGRNVGGLVEGSDPKLRHEIVIVSAHYDHLGSRGDVIYRGADDNASGVSMMLEVARQIAQSPVKPRRSIVFIGFDLEEHMLWGSRWFAAHPPWPIEQVKLFITADMIGRSLGDLPLNNVFALGSERASGLRETLDEVGHPQGLEVARLGIDLIGTRSDYGPFRDRKIPFLFFSTGEHPDYHTPRDVPEKVDYEKVAQVSSLVLRVATRVANSDEPPKWLETPAQDLDEVRALNRITELLLKDEERFSDLQKFVVVHAQSKTKQILDRGEITPAERTWLIRISQLLLLSVF